MEDIIVSDFQETVSEILTDFNIDSFSYEYERNNTRQISFTAFKTSRNEDIYNILQNEAYIDYQGQRYIIKSCTASYDGLIQTKEIVASHIMFEFQNHYVSKDISSESLNDENSESKPQQLTLKEFLEFAFKNNKIDFSYEIIGKFDKSVSIEELGGKNGIEYIVEGAELFDYIYFADNKKIYFYDAHSFYQLTEKVIRYKYNNDSVKASIDTRDLKTVVKGYGKKLTEKDTKNYTPIKPPQLTYTGTFIKEGTWRTEQIGASFSYTLNCKYGNETIVFSLKRMSKGGVVQIYFDNKSVGEYSCYSKTANTQNITLKKGADKGKHTIKVVFKGPKDKIDYKKSKPCMYVGTEKATVINTTAKLTGEQLYSTVYEYKSSNYSVFGRREAPDVFDDNAKELSDLKKTMLKEFKDSPDIDLEINYVGEEPIRERDSIWFVHEIMGFDSELKVVRLKKSHPLNKMPDEIGFSNNQKDIVQINNTITSKIKKVSNALNRVKFNNIYSVQPLKYQTGSIVGSVIIDE